MATTVLATAACGRGGEVQTGAAAGAGPDDAAEIVQRSVTKALAAGTYRIRLGTADPSGSRQVTGTVCGIDGSIQARDIAVGDGGHRTALLDSRSGAVRVVHDDREPVAYLATATLPGAASAPVQWVRLGAGDLAAVTGLASLAPSLWNDLGFAAGPFADRGLLTVIQRSAATVTAVDRGEIDGVAVSHQHVTVDEARFADAARDQFSATPTGSPLLDIPPGTIRTLAEAGGTVPTFDTWVDESGTLRRISADGLMPTGMDPAHARIEVTYSAFDEPFPATMPAPDATTDLGSLPASVLLPLPDCADIGRALPPAGAGVPPAMIEAFTAYSTCVTDAREQAAPGRTLTQWLPRATAVAFDGTCPLPAMLP